MARSSKSANNNTLTPLNPGGKLVACKVKKVIYDGASALAAQYGGYDAVGLIFFNKIKKDKLDVFKDNNADFNEQEDLKIYDGIAKPLFPFMKYYPLVNEVVPIITLVSKDYGKKRTSIVNYYIPPINLWNHPHHNSLPALQNYLEEGTGYFTNEDYEDAGLLRRPNEDDSSVDIPLGVYFNEKINIKPLLPYEGDYIIEGRFGNSIRFGATARSEFIPVSQSNNWSTGTKGEVGDPITIIRNGQSVNLDNQGWVHTLENINTDPSSIYLTSNQKIDNFAIAAPDCWYSFGLNAIIPQNDNEEAKKFLDSPVDFMIAEEVEVEETTPPNEDNQEEINEGQSTSNTQTEVTGSDVINYECPPGQVWNEEIQACVIPEVVITGSISEEEAGFVDEEINPRTYQLTSGQTEPEIIDSNLPDSYKLAGGVNSNNCGNCFFHENNYCNNWKAKVRGNHENPWICNAWKEIKPLPSYRIAGGAREGQIEYLRSDGTYNFLQSFLTLSDGEKRAVFFFGKQVGFRLQISAKHMQGLVYIDDPSAGGCEENIRVAKQQISLMDSKIFREAVLNGGVGPGK